MRYVSERLCKTCPCHAEKQGKPNRAVACVGCHLGAVRLYTKCEHLISHDRMLKCRSHVKWSWTSSTISPDFRLCTGSAPPTIVVTRGLAGLHRSSFDWTSEGKLLQITQYVVQTTLKACVDVPNIMEPTLLRHCIHGPWSMQRCRGL